MIIKYAVGRRLLLVTWCLASKHAIRSGKMANEKKLIFLDFLGISKPYIWSLALGL